MSEEDLREAIELSREVGSVFGEVLSAQRLALLETRLGRYEEAHTRLLEAKDLAGDSTSALVRVHTGTRILSSLAYNRLEAGQIAQAAEYLALGFAAQEEVGECASCDVLLYPVAVPVYIALDDMEQASWACGKAEEVATAFKSQAWIATAYYLRGLMAQADGDMEGAASKLRYAVDIFKTLPQPYEAAQTMETLAEVVAAAPGNIPDDPAALLTEAASNFESLGSMRAAGRARELLSRLTAK